MLKVLVVLVTCLVASTAALKHSWQTPGCHKVGHTRRISIPECVEFDITTNACRGFCESWSVPSAWQTLLYNPHQIVTSIGQCCNIMDTEDVKVKVMCIEGPRELVFKSARTCACFHCKKY
ncbi:thyrostimulin alpha-2 subunit [Penaeus vannamei]|uniref:thyrostimulin alpha-2 subunit-like n=1 Tax=Penaeus monodon TaxID=6687 RepID=UPI000F66DCA4|nr:thyrostimulin alpha-2 subunit-like [Penaeus vannamei]XP_037801426.1 thyrostimulin alpha-2 subunit-like [Penaeus monodon]XP_042867385.1 thyrostimulin alpha-2 subunit-like [Penaeus japonicus]XP_047501996.1 thyrostimulin alpha-2 subunit-like [Penaeus chinensis]